MKVKYTHPSRTNLIDSKRTYELDEVKKIDKFKKDYKKYFSPVEGVWKDYEPKSSKKDEKLKIEQ